METYFNPKKNLDFEPFKKEHDPGIKVLNKWQVFIRKVFTLFCGDSGIFKFNPNGSKNYFLSKKETIDWVNRHSDSSNKILGKIGNKALLARIEDIYNSKIATPSGGANSSSILKTANVSASKTANVSAPKPEKGGFSNAGMTSYLSMALQYLDTILLSLPAMPSENDIVQMPGEDINKFNTRKQIAGNILKMIDKINSGENCSVKEMSSLLVHLNQFDPYSFSPLNTGGDAWMATESLALIFFPDHAPFVHKAACSMINVADVKTAIGNSLAGLGPNTAKNEGPCDVKYVFQQFNKPLPDFHSLNLRFSPAQGKDLPKTFELAGQTQNATYELVGFTISGADHSFIGLEKGKWVQYESENIAILSASQAEQIFLSQKFDMVLYRRVS